MICTERTFSSYHDGLSTANEPEVGSVFSMTSVRKYPDMSSLYATMSSFFGVKPANIILTNGCENALKNVLLAVKPETLSWSTPTWSFVDILCEQLSIQPHVHPFTLDKTIATERIFAESVDAYYGTIEANNLVYTQSNPENLRASRVAILDASYVAHNSLSKLKNYVNDKTIVVGSFDKLYGCGLRLGFALFPDNFISAIQLQREAYINACAAQFIQEKHFQQPPRYIYTSRLANVLATRSDVILTNNYISILKHVETDVPCKHFSIDNVNCTRFGIPTNEQEFDSLVSIIESQSL